jgi:hypothetical protein
MPLNDLSVTRFPNGISTSAENTIASSLPFPDPTKFHTFLTDFYQFIAAEWLITETQAGALQSLVPVNGGVLQLLNSAALNDINQIQKTPLTSLLDPAKKLFMKFRLSLNDANLTHLAVGLYPVVPDATNAAAIVQGISMIKPSGSNNVTVYVRRDAGVNGVSAIAQFPVPSGLIGELTFYWDGAGRLYYGTNNTVLGYLQVPPTSFPNVILAPTIAIKNGEAVAKSAAVDLIFLAQEI